MFRQPISWREVDRLRRDMNRLFENSLPRWQRQRTASFPAINAWNNEQEGVIVTAELPGVKPENVNISVTADTLTISGSRFPDETAEEVKYHRQERTCGEFSRTFQLPYAVNNNKVEAVLEKGVLQVTLPRAEAEKPKQIKVKTG